MGFSPSEKARLIGRVNTLEKAIELLEMRVDKHAAALKKMSGLIADLVAEKKESDSKKPTTPTRGNVDTKTAK